MGPSILCYFNIFFFCFVEDRGLLLTPTEVFMDVGHESLRHNQHDMKELVDRHAKGALSAVSDILEK